MGIRFGAPSLTPTIKWLIIVNAAVWLFQILSQQFFNMAYLFGVVPERVLHGWIWQPLTYMFLHSPRDPFHLLFNMLMLWMFGGELERYWGRRAFLRYYIVCGVGAGLAAVIFGLAVTGMATIPTIGASGAIYGLFVAFGMVFADRQVLFMLIFPMKARTMALILFGIAFFYAVTARDSGISHIAHLGGAVVGFLYLIRVWRLGEFYRELKWKIQRRRFKVMRKPDDDFDRWVH
jgi:membrane associated rhomboid family serine protease